jgi:hypothetical protein
MSLFQKSRKVDIQIIKTESLKKTDEAQESGDPVKPQITILGTQRIREQLSDEEILEVAQQFGQMGVPEIVRRAQQARQAHEIDQAILMLRDHVRRYGANIEVERELQTCMRSLEDSSYFQHVANSQLAALLFEGAGFRVAKQSPPSNLTQQGVLETSFTVECEDRTLQGFLTRTTGSPYRFLCYCMTEFDRQLDTLTLGLIQTSFGKRGRTINPSVHFVICKESGPAANSTINLCRVQNGFVTIPLARPEVQQAILTSTERGYIQIRVSNWMSNHRLYVAPAPVVQDSEFFGREDKTREITNALDAKQSFCLLGLRRMGKTSLIKRLAEFGAFRNHLCAFLDTFLYVDQPNFDEAVASLRGQWQTALAVQFPQAAGEVERRTKEGATAFDHLLAFLDAISAICDETQNNISCLAIIDDLNFAVQRDGDGLWQRGAGRLVRLLRSKQVLTGLLVWDFAARDLIERDQTGGLGRYTTIYLGPLHRNECDKMIIDIGSIINMKYKAEALDAIYNETGGQPLWTRVLCDKISGERRSAYEALTVTQADVDHAATEFLNLEHRHLSEIVNLLSGTDYRVLQQLASASAPLPTSGLGPQGAEAAEQLRKYGLAEESPSGSGRYVVRMHLLARYLQSKSA